MDDQIYIGNKLRLFNAFWLFLIIELAVFFLITRYYLAPETLTQSITDFDIGFLYVSYLVAIISIPGIYKIYNIRRKKIKKDADIKEKLDKYMFLLLIKYAILEIAALLLLIAFYINEIKEPLYMFGIVFVAVLLNKPSLKQFTNDFLGDNDENVIEEIVYMPDELNKPTEDIRDENSELK